MHLEIVMELSSKAFLPTLDRFTARRGIPAEVFSDNGSNFIGAQAELKKMYQLVQDRSSAAVIVGPTPPPGCRDEGLFAQKARGVRGAVRTDGVADHPSEGDVVVRRSGI